MRNLDLPWLVLLLVLASCGSSAAPAAHEPQTSQCEPGHDQTCNDEARVSSLWGRCDQGQCVCNSGFAINPETGRCRPAGG